MVHYLTLLMTFGGYDLTHVNGRVLKVLIKTAICHHRRPIVMVPASGTADLRITQAVNGNKGIHLMLDKRHLKRIEGRVTFPARAFSARGGASERLRPANGLCNRLECQFRLRTRMTEQISLGECATCSTQENQLFVTFHSLSGRGNV